PVIATQVGGVPEQILHGVTGYVVPFKDYSSMAHVITEFMHDSSKQQQFSKAAVDDVTHRFTLDKMLEHYTAFYFDIIETKLKYKVNERI
ncbi:MAG: glycosyltransferase, partial [Bacteroidia bacterium]